MTWIAVEQLHVTRGGVLVQSSTPTAQSGGEARGQHQPRDGEQQDGPLSDVLGQPGEGQHHPVQPVTWHQEITAFLSLIKHKIFYEQFQENTAAILTYLINHATIGLLSTSRFEIESTIGSLIVWSRSQDWSNIYCNFCQLKYLFQFHCDNLTSHW